MQTHRQVRRRIYVFVITGGIGIIALVLFTLQIQLPTELANHFGFALPGEYGLPYRITYLNRYYETLYACADASWCRSAEDQQSQGGAAHSPCFSHQELELHDNNWWPLMKVGTIPVLWSVSSYPILVSQAESRRFNGKVTDIYVQAASNCYVPYGLSGSW